MCREQFAPVEIKPIRVWGEVGGEQFDREFPSTRAWRAWRRLQRVEVEVRGMQSVEHTPCC